ncbi:MAG: EAL domain-containing protein [Allorhizobium sp.]
MIGKSIYANLVRLAGGPWTTAYGPFLLQSAFQPIFRQLPNGLLDIDSLEGFVRVDQNGEACPPSQLFAAVRSGERPDVDSLLRTIHILNAGLMKRSRAKLFLSFDPALYPPNELRREIEHIRLAGHEAGIVPDRIVCAISGDSKAGIDALADCAERLRQTGFRIAVSNYGASETDVALIRLMQADYVKFDGHWVRDYMHNSAGLALLKVVVRQFSEDGVQPIFDRLEDHWQIDVCREIGVPLLQGFALARPEIAPTSFDEQYPEMLLPLAPAFRDSDAPPAAQAAVRQDYQAQPARRSGRAAPVFGKRQS